MTKPIERYLSELTQKAQAAGLDMAKPGSNWAPMRPLIRGTHISTSVTKDKVQVNLNNDRDEDRQRYNALVVDRASIDTAIGIGLKWEKEGSVKKTVIRATRDGGYDVSDWDEQHEWAITMMKAFIDQFGPRLARFG
jgi:hypothetical protein